MRRLTYTLSLIGLVLAPVNVYAHGADHEVRITDEGFGPSNLEINQGETIEFINERNVPVWPASDIHPTHGIYPEFDPKKEIDPGEEWTMRFEKAGEWSMHDHLNPSVVGKIIVKGQEEAEDGSEPNKKTSFVDRVEIIKVSFLKFFYDHFPKVLERKLDSVDMHEVAGKPEEIEYYMRLIGVGGVMNELLADSGDGTLRDCHQEAHNTGRVAYKLYGSEAFTYGNSACHSGFYHGAMEEFLKEEGTFNLATKIENICAKFPTDFSKFECLHGVGHGVMAYKSYDLPEALETCNQLNTDFDQSSCYGGVFMENIVTAQGIGATPGHETEWVSDDPHFPCNTLEDGTGEMYECYKMQTSWILSLGGGFESLVEECQKAPVDMITTCFLSFGRDAAGYALREPEKIINYCNMVPEKYRFSCIAGGLNVIVDFAGERLGEEAAELCALLPDNPTKVDCFNTLSGRAEQIFGKDNNLALEKVCPSSGKSYSTFCRGDFDPYVIYGLE